MAEYIEREALLNAFDIADPDVMADYGQDYGTAWGYSRDAVKNLVRLIPTADVAPVRHGRWLLLRPGEWTATYKCSECGRHITIDPRDENWRINYPYCHCGCKMDKEVANER